MWEKARLLGRRQRSQQVILDNARTPPSLSIPRPERALLLMCGIVHLAIIAKSPGPPLPLGAGIPPKERPIYL